MITKQEINDAVRTLAVDLYGNEDGDLWRNHLCSLVISGTKSAFLLKIAFDCASWINDRRIRNKIWLDAIKKGVESYEKLDRNSNAYREAIGYSMYMEQIYKDNCYK